MPPNRGQVVHVVERRDRLDVGRRELHSVRDLAERLGRQPPVVPLLREMKRVHDRRAAVGVELPELLHPLVELGGGHRSVSPITESSEPTIAIRSAISASLMQVAVASSATNDGARNLTRHGRGPPSETT